MAIGRFAACLLVDLLVSSFFAGDLFAQVPPRQVELELVLAMDTSSSVDAAEFELQKQAMADAFRHPDVLDAIESCGGSDIAVAVVQWADNWMQLLSADWTLIGDKQSAAGFADKVAATRRLLTGFTGLDGAIRFSLKLIEENDLEGRRKIIDISGNGASNGPSPNLERDKAVGRGITINGLAMLHDEPDLDLYFAKHVIGGGGAFVLRVKSLDGFAEAIREKLVREIGCPKIARVGPPDEG